MNLNNDGRIFAVFGEIVKDLWVLLCQTLDILSQSWKNAAWRRILVSLTEFPMKYRQVLNHNKMMWIRYIPFTPLVFFQFIPIVLIDLSLEIYHQFGFRLMGIPLIVRPNYIRIDRQKLSYLKWYEKIGCAYCAYANGWFRYASAIAAATEAYWCGIMNQKYNGFKEPEHHKDFLPYGDEKAFDEFVKK